MNKVCSIWSSYSSYGELPKKSKSKPRTLLETSDPVAFQKNLEELVVGNLIDQSDLDRFLLHGPGLVQRKETELSRIAPQLTILLQFGAKVTRGALLEEHKTPYHIICESPGDHHELLDLMIKSSPRTLIDRLDISMFTPLLYAVRHANINCVRCLIANGADANLGDYSYRHVVPNVPLQQWFPIMEAIKMLGHGYQHTCVNVQADIFNLLLDSGVKVNPSVYGSSSPIVIAVCLQNKYCIKKLIKKGARLDIVGPDQSYVWSSIAALGDVELLKCMVNHGVSKDIRDRDGVCLLRHVVTGGSIESVRYLLDLGVVIPIYTPNVPQTLCLQCKRYIPVLEDYNQLDHRDPCMSAIIHNKLEIVKLLDEHTSQSCRSFKALRSAILNGCVNVVAYLLNKYKYHLNAQYSRYIYSDSKHGCQQSVTLFTELNLHLFTESKLRQITKLLLDNGGDPDRSMCLFTSSNAIMTAIYSGHLGIIAQYIRSGVNFNVRSYDNKHGFEVFPFEASVLLGSLYLAEILLISGCFCGKYSLEFTDDIEPEIENLMKEWKVQENNVTSLRQKCRSVILNQLSPRADKKIEKLPLPKMLIKFLYIHEIDDIINKAKLRH